MNAKVLPENLYKAVKQVKVSKLQKFPILNHALLETKDGRLRITTWDFETGKQFTAQCAASIHQEFAVCVPMIDKKFTDNGYQNTGHWRTFHPFLDFCKVASEVFEYAISLTYDPNFDILTIKSSFDANKSKTEFKCIDASEFPETLGGIN